MSATPVRPVSTNEYAAQLRTGLNVFHLLDIAPLEEDGSFPETPNWSWIMMRDTADETVDAAMAEGRFQAPMIEGTILQFPEPATRSLDITVAVPIDPTFEPVYFTLYRASTDLLPVRILKVFSPVRVIENVPAGTKAIMTPYTVSGGAQGVDNSAVLVQSFTLGASGAPTEGTVTAGVASFTAGRWAIA